MGGSVSESEELMILSFCWCLILKNMKEQASGLVGMKVVKWKFNKFLIEIDGKVVGYFALQMKPVDLEIVLC